MGRPEIILKGYVHDKADNCKQTVASVILVNTEEGLRAKRDERSLEEEGEEEGPRLMVGWGKHEQQQQPANQQGGDSCGILGGRV